MVAVEQQVSRLVVVAHQAVVAGGGAVFGGVRRAVSVVAGLGIEVTDLERAAGDAAERILVSDELAQDSGAAFGRNPRIVRFDGEGRKEAAWGREPGPGKLAEPQG